MLFYYFGWLSNEVYHNIIKYMFWINRILQLGKLQNITVY